MSDGIKYAVMFYYTSDETGLDVRMRVLSDVPIPEVTEPKIPLAKLPDFVTDWRFMTAAEVDAYENGTDEDDE
jgi:hypothetical protein